MKGDDVDADQGRALKRCRRLFYAVSGEAVPAGQAPQGGQPAAPRPWAATPAATAASRRDGNVVDADYKEVD